MAARIVHDEGSASFVAQQRHHSVSSQDLLSSTDHNILHCTSHVAMINVAQPFQISLRFKHAANRSPRCASSMPQLGSTVTSHSKQDGIY